MCQLAELVPQLARVFEEDGDVVIGIGPRRTARARAEQHHALKPIAVDFGHGIAETSQHRVVLWVFHLSIVTYTPVASKTWH